MTGKRTVREINHEILLLTDAALDSEDVGNITRTDKPRVASQQPRAVCLN